ncbi:hypothetical protein EYF80_043303 [Liparis tanakae]|uniref:Uncharacterized protein n=1 Tax=Liparis tanakae TaxID=230148 RepID=A0A4Z2G076_9TELE|nr:hypothetical protein EYF80_043303 [Liparis tanakae]
MASMNCSLQELVPTTRARSISMATEQTPPADGDCVGLKAPGNYIANPARPLSAYRAGPGRSWPVLAGPGRSWPVLAGPLLYRQKPGCCTESSRVHRTLQKAP